MKRFTVAESRLPGDTVTEQARQQRVKMCSPRKWFKGAFCISTDPHQLDKAFILSADIMRDLDNRDMALALSNSLCFGLYRNDRQIGFARVVSDFACTAFIHDIFISPEYRFIGMGSWLLQCCFAHPAVRSCRRIIHLHAEPAGFFSKNGFVASELTAGVYLSVKALH